jgi:hypothetical protein
MSRTQRERHGETQQFAEGVTEGVTEGEDQSILHAILRELKALREDVKSLTRRVERIETYLGIGSVNHSNQRLERIEQFLGIGNGSVNRCNVVELDDLIQQ